MFREPFPILYVADIQRSIRFYCEVFGFSIGYRWPADGDRCDYAFLRLPPCGIGLVVKDVQERLLGRALDRSGPPSFELCFSVEDVERAAAHLRAQGARELVPPTDRPWGERTAYFEDPDGIPIHIAATIRQ